MSSIAKTVASSAHLGKVKLHVPPVLDKDSTTRQICEALLNDVTSDSHQVVMHGCHPG
jgi:hypothetical protein